MRVVCIHVVTTGGPAVNRDGDVIGPGNQVDNLPGSTIEVPDHEVSRLLQLGAVRLADDKEA